MDKYSEKKDGYSTLESSKGIDCSKVAIEAILDMPDDCTDGKIKS